MTRNYILCSACFDLGQLKKADGETCFDAGYADGFCEKCRRGLAQYINDNPPDGPGHEHDLHDDATLFNARK